MRSVYELGVWFGGFLGGGGGGGMCECIFMDAVASVCVCVCVCVFCLCAMQECASLFRPTHPFCVPTDLYSFPIYG